MQDQVFPFARYWPERCLKLKSDLLYDTPDRLITLLQLPPQTMILGYEQLLECSLPLRPFWGLEQEHPPQVEPLSGLLVSMLIKKYPDLLKNYQAVDLRAGRDGDSNYIERLKCSIDQDRLLQSFHEVGDLRRELDDQLRLVRRQRKQLDDYLKMQIQSQNLLSNMINRSNAG